MKRAVAIAVSACALCVSSACREPTQITFEVRTDLRCDEVGDTAIATGLADTVERSLATATSSTCVDGRVGLLVVAPSSDDSAELAVRIVTATKGKRVEDCADTGYAGCIVSRRAIRYASHKTLRVNVTMRASCINAPCDAASFTTCVKGSCVPGRVDSDACDDSGCDETLLDGPKTDATCPPAVLPPGASASGWTKIPGLSSIGLGPRSAHVAVWTCGEVFVWGGAQNSSAPNGTDVEGAAYSPATNRWRKTSPPPAAFERRAAASAVWTGRQVFMWGGIRLIGTDGDIRDDGALYDPVTDAWVAIPPDPALPQRLAPSVAYSPITDEVIVWGGRTAGALADGAAFDLKARRWRKIAPAPPGFAGRGFAAAAFIDGRFVVAGGLTGPDPGTAVADGAAWDPVTDTWSLLPPSGLAAGTFGASSLAATRGGSKVEVVFGIAPAEGAFYDGTVWTRIPGLPAATLASPARSGAVLWSTGSRIYAWGGRAGTTDFADGAFLDFASRAWTKMPASVLTARTGAAAAWTGRFALIVGGGTAANVFEDAAIYVP